MLQVLHQWFVRTPRRLVQGGLSMLFAGGTGLLLGMLAQSGADGAGAPLLAERFPQWPTFWIPESPEGYTAAALLVCWGVWSMGAGLKLARGEGTH